MTPRRRARVALELFEEAVIEVLDAADWPLRRREVAARLKVRVWVADAVLHSMAEGELIHQPRGRWTGWTVIDD